LFQFLLPASEAAASQELPTCKIYKQIIKQKDDKNS